MFVDKLQVFHPEVMVQMAPHLTVATEVVTAQRALTVTIAAPEV